MATTSMDYSLYIKVRMQLDRTDAFYAILNIRLLLEELEISWFGCFFDEHYLETAGKLIELVDTNQSFKLGHEYGIIEAEIVAKDESNLGFYFKLIDGTSCFSLKPEESGRHVQVKWNSRLASPLVQYLVKMGIWCPMPSSNGQSDSIFIVSPIAEKAFKFFSVYCRSDLVSNVVLADRNALCYSHYSMDAASQSSSNLFYITKALIHRPARFHDANEELDVEKLSQLPPRDRMYFCQTPEPLKLMPESHLSERLQPVLNDGGIILASVPSSASSFRLCYAKTKKIPSLLSSLNRIGYHDLDIDVDNSSIYVKRLKLKIHWDEDSYKIESDELKSLLEVSRLLIV